MSARRRLYLDNAATSFPKPPGVYEALVRYGRDIGATPGRANYAESLEGGRVIGLCRERLCHLVNGESPDHIIFTLNTTDALNLAIKGIVSHRRSVDPGRPIHLVTTAMDHNSVLRPFNALRERGVEWTCVDADPASGLVDPEDIRRALTPDTVLVAIVHASNVTGTIQPAAEVGAICRGRGVPFLLDAAQTLGRLPIDVRALGVDLLAFPGHKSLLGPLGTGGLYIRPGVERILSPLREGGTGSASDRDVQPLTMPDRYEPGSHNAPGIAGLSEAVGWILGREVESIRAHELTLVRAALEQLDDLESAGLRMLGPRDAERRVGVLSFAHDVISARPLADELERRFGVLVRPGVHCAPRAHRTLGTPPGGAVRVSFGPFVTEADVLRACAALHEACREMTRTLVAPSA